MIRRAVIDTGPLYEALKAHYERPSDLRVLELLASIPEKLTTSHVMGEINGLVNTRLKLYGPKLDRFWGGSIELLTQWNLDERLVRLLDFAGDSSSEIVRVGLVDTGLIHLARENGCILITIDERTLAPLAWEQCVDCRLLSGLL